MTPIVRILLILPVVLQRSFLMSAGPCASWVSFHRGVAIGHLDSWLRPGLRENFHQRHRLAALPFAFIRRLHEGEELDGFGDGNG